MSRKVRFAVGVAVVLVLGGTSYIMSNESTAEARRPMTAQMDIDALTAGAKNLPVQHFDAF
jgi:hypothetical protein